MTAKIDNELRAALAKLNKQELHFLRVYIEQLTQRDICPADQERIGLAFTAGDIAAAAEILAQITK